MAELNDVIVEFGITHRAKALATTGLALTVIPEGVRLEYRGTAGRGLDQFRCFRRQCRSGLSGHPVSPVLPVTGCHSTEPFRLASG